MNTALEIRRREWVDVVNRGDVDGYADLVTEDVVWMAPGAAVINGRRGFADWLAPFFERFNYEYAVQDPQIRQVGDHAVERADFVSMMTPSGGGEPMQHTGSFFVLWRRCDDGAWRIERYADVTGLEPGR